MITEKDISGKLNIDIKSPIRLGDLNGLGIPTKSFLSFFKPFFEELHNDEYLKKEKQITFLQKALENDSAEIEKLHQSYFKGEISIGSFEHFIQKLSLIQKEEFKNLSFITRQRNISSFIVDINKDSYHISRTVDDGFKQNVEDFRTWKRVFTEASKECVENELFFELLKKIASLVQSIHKKVTKIKVTSHFMRTISKAEIPGENSPEGIHEDGAQYIISALVINRQNITGAESQIFEKPKTGDKKLIYNKVLEPGEFIFQADTGEEVTFGNDLWHYVTPIQSIDKSKPGIRDIIGLDINILG